MGIQYRPLIHPLMAAAAVSTTLVSVMGIAALSGVLPWMPGAATQKLPPGLPLAGIAVAPAAIVLPTAALKPSTPPSAAESLRPGETLITAYTRAAPRAVALAPAAASTSIATVSTPAQPTFAGSTPPAAALTLAQSIMPTAKQQALEATRTASLQPAPSMRERQRNREATLVATSGNSTDGSSSTGAQLRSSRGAPQPNDPQRYSDARRTATSSAGITTRVSNGTSRITPIYRADAPPDASPSTNYDDPELQPSRRSGNRTAGDIAVVSERGRTEPNRRYAGDDRDATPATYPVASVYTGGDSSNSIGSTIGKTVSKGIDKTISVISDVLSGRYVPPPPVDPQDNIYR